MTNEKPASPTTTARGVTAEMVEALRRIAAMRYADEDADIYDTLEQALDTADAALAAAPQGKRT